MQKAIAMRVMTLDSNHRWRATPGCRILLIDGGAVRFDFPRHWLVDSGRGQILLLDRQPPDERSCIGLRWRRISPIETMLPLGFLLNHSTTAEQRFVLHRGQVIRIFRPPLEAAWIQLRVLDKGREICTRMCVARGGCTQVIIVADFHPAEEDTFFRVWKTFLETLAVGDYVVDPISGRRYEQRG